MVIMNVLQNRLIYWLTFISISLFSFSTQAASFYATVSKNKVVKNEVFQLRIISDQKASSDDLDFSVLEKDFFLGRPSFGSSINIINGTRSNKSEWTISLAANRIGFITIPSFELNGDKTQAISIQVAQDEQAPEISDLVEVQSQLSKNELYPNESALLKVRLIIKADPRRLQDPKITPPSVEGLELKAANEANQYQTIVDGVEVTIVDQDFRITASNAGRYQLSEPVFKGTIVYGSRYNGGTRLVPIETVPKLYSITVQPKPDNYQGDWLPASALSLTQKWFDSKGNVISEPKISTSVGDSVTREVRIQVTGLTQEQLPNIKVNYPTSVSLYDEKPQFETLESGDVVMTVKQVLIPRQSGEIELPSITVNWWNTDNQQQQTSSLTGLTLEVEQSETSLVPASTPIQPPVKIETVTVKDSGFWPYLTGLFALLWMVTLIIAWRIKSANTYTKTEGASASESNEYQVLEQALTQKDGIAISAALKAWLSTVIIEEQEQIQIDEALNQISESLYSSEPKPIETKQLQRLIKQVEKQQTKRHKAKPATLEKL